jgi:hypothetical protein
METPKNPRNAGRKKTGRLTKFHTFAFQYTEKERWKVEKIKADAKASGFSVREYVFLRIFAYDPECSPDFD